MNNNRELNQQLIQMLIGRPGAMQFDDVVRNFPAAHFNTKPPNTAYSFWHLIEHVRICQADMVDYMLNDTYSGQYIHSGYWVSYQATTDKAGWQQSIQGFLADRQRLVTVLENPQTDVFRPVRARHASGDKGKNLLRSIIVTAGHNGYHIGEFAILRGMLNLW